MVRLLIPSPEHTDYSRMVMTLVLGEWTVALVSSIPKHKSRHVAAIQVTSMDSTVSLSVAILFITLLNKKLLIITLLPNTALPYPQGKTFTIMNWDTTMN